jgi:hypothetical protein
MQPKKPGTRDSLTLYYLTFGRYILPPLDMRLTVCPSVSFSVYNYVDNIDATHRGCQCDTGNPLWCWDSCMVTATRYPASTTQRRREINRKQAKRCNAKWPGYRTNLFQEYTEHVERLYNHMERICHRQMMTGNENSGNS